jgi:hypothetical protein
MNATWAQRLRDLPAEIQEAEERLRAAVQTLECQERARQAEEDRIILGQDAAGRTLSGKNAEIRAAELRFWLCDEDLAIFQMRSGVEQAKIALHRKLNEFSAARAMTRLVAGGNE